MPQFDEKSCGAIIFKIEQNQNLYLTVEYKKEKGYWGLVKGHVEPDETELETAKREIYEEVGLTDLTFFDDFRAEHSYQPKAGVSKQVIFFLSQANCDKVEYLWGEHIAHLWLPADEVITRLKYDGDREIIRQAEAFLSGGAGKRVSG